MLRPSHRAATTAAVVAFAGALAACSQDVTAPAAPVAATPRAAWVPPDAGTVTGAIDSVVVGADPSPVQNGTATVPVTVYANPTPGTATATIACGDGSATTVTATAGGTTATCSYTAPGVYGVTATAPDGTTATAPTYAVVYDPRGGFVTGGGWIVSPTGAYAPNPALTARASFGFVAKYLPGRQVPDGETEFQFRAAGFNFHGGVYQWLVVSGSRAQYRGTGSVNGVDGYDFQVTIVDGDLIGRGVPDRFRIKIWSPATGVVYDNQRGATDDLGVAATTALDGGSISIKK